LKLRVLRPSRSKFNRPIFVVNNGRMWILQDFQAINQNTKFDKPSYWDIQ
jgi:hypothetical protein